MQSMVYIILNKKKTKAKRERKNLMPKNGQNYTINKKNERRGLQCQQVVEKLKYMKSWQRVI